MDVAKQVQFWPLLNELYNKNSAVHNKLLSKLGYLFIRTSIWVKKDNYQNDNMLNWTKLVPPFEVYISFHLWIITAREAHLSLGTCSFSGKKINQIFKFKHELTTV